MEKEFGNYFLNEETGVFEAYDQHESEAEENFDVLLKTERKKRRKELRLMGKQYSERSARKMKNKACPHLAQIKTKRSILCGAIDDDCRKDTFKYFWNLPSWEAKKSYIMGLVELCKTPIRRRPTTINAKKKCVILIVIFHLQMEKSFAFVKNFFWGPLI